MDNALLLSGIISPHVDPNDAISKFFGKRHIAEHHKHTHRDANPLGKNHCEHFDPVDGAAKSDGKSAADTRSSPRQHSFRGTAGALAFTDPILF